MTTRTAHPTAVAALADFGAIVIGAGHNGLICAAYLARAGIKVNVLEARASVGGNAATEIALGGARVNICNCDHTMVRATPIIEELGLAGHGLRYLDSDLVQTNIHWDGGPAWVQFHDVARTLDGLGRTYPGEVANYEAYLKEAVPVARLVVDVANDAPTPGSVIPKVVRRRVAGVPTMMRWTKQSIGASMRRYFQTEQLRSPLIATGPAVWGLSPETPGTGMGSLGYALRHVVKPGRPVGGSGSLPAAIAAAVLEAGGEIRCGSRVTKILCEGANVIGVALGDGETVRAPIVVVATDPHAALVEWLTDAPPQAAALIARYRGQDRHDGYESKVDAVVDQPYQYHAMSDDLAAGLGVTHDEVRNASMIVSPSLHDMATAFDLQRRGVIADRPMFFANSPSVRDPSMAVDLPAGSDVFSIEVIWTPYELAGGWEGSSEPQRWLRTFGQLVRTRSGVPFEETVRASRLMGPREYEQQFSMDRGYAPSFSGTPVSALLGKDRELSRYSTPVQGLFLTGAATFPGAGIWGASGRNAATAILASDSRSAKARRAHR